jgi:hypothetical protein
MLLMNERIKQLIMEAVNFRLDPDSDAYEAQVCPEDLEYLAELIVKDCANVADKYVRDGDIDIAVVIRRNYGFEELKPCKSPYCECEIGKCTHPGFYDARGEE